MRRLACATGVVPPVNADHAPGDIGEAALEDKVRFLSMAGSYPGAVHRVDTRQTHMSWLFLTESRVYKLKKPVRFPYLDFSTLEKREAACRAELELNRRLARPTYLDVVPLRLSSQGLSFDRGSIVEWIVVMRRLDTQDALESLIGTHSVEVAQLDRLVRRLAEFYRHARRVYMSPDALVADWHRRISYDQQLLSDRRFALPAGTARRIGRAQRRFLDHYSSLLAERVRKRWILDGHGDLRPEHIWLGEPVQIIDCVEFNPHLRAVDPLDELAYLSVECDRLGAAWVGEYVTRHIARQLHEDVPDALFSFYRCHRASLRARLAIAHLLDPHARTPEKWPRVARDYLRIAEREAAKLERLLSAHPGLAACDRTGGDFLTQIKKVWRQPLHIRNAARPGAGLEAARA